MSLKLTFLIDVGEYIALLERQEDEIESLRELEKEEAKGVREMMREQKDEVEYWKEKYYGDK